MVIPRLRARLRATYATIPSVVEAELLASQVRLRADVLRKRYRAAAGGEGGLLQDLDRPLVAYQPSARLFSDRSEAVVVYQGGVTVEERKSNRGRRGSAGP